MLPDRHAYRTISTARCYETKDMMRIVLSILMCCFFLQANARKLKLTPFLPESNPTETAVIICPGGSYFWLDKDVEGSDVARWLNANGIAAFVLEYSHAGWAAFAYHIRLGGRSFPMGHNDLLNALREVKDNAATYGIRPDRVGCMGFSAGGHLVMYATEQLAGTELCPAFAALIYPVVSMQHPCTHKRSRRGLLGEFPSKRLLSELSVEQHVPDNCPPVFLMNCDDDPIVNPQNSQLLDSALASHGIEHEYVCYKTGGHGFGVMQEKTTVEAIGWKERLIAWLDKLFE